MSRLYLLVQIYSEFLHSLLILIGVQANKFGVPSETVRSTQKSVKDPSNSPVEGREVKVRVKKRLS